MIKISNKKLVVDKYEMTDEVYFSDKYKTHISNSSIGLLNPDQGGGPDKFINGFSDKTSSLELGSVIHNLILEKDIYKIADGEKPSGKVGPIIEYAFKMRETLSFREAVIAGCRVNEYYANSLTDARINGVIEKGMAYYEYLQESSDPNSLYLTTAVKEKAIACVNSVKNNKAANELFSKGDDVFGKECYFEDVIMGDIVITYTDSDDDLGIPSDMTIPIKGKIDSWSIDHDNKIICLNDLKTTSKSILDFPGRNKVSHEPLRMGNTNAIVPITEFVPGSFQFYRYYRQMAFYKDLLLAYLRTKYDNIDEYEFKVNIIVVETLQPHRSQVFCISDKWLRAGDAECKSLFERLIWHKLNGFDKILELHGRSIIEI